MNKLLPWLSVVLMALILSAGAGSVVIKPDPETAPPLSNGYFATRSVCGASPSLMASIIDRMPIIWQASGLFRDPERLIRAKLPATASTFSGIPEIGAAAIGQIIVKTAPCFF